MHAQAMLLKVRTDGRGAAALSCRGSGSNGGLAIRGSAFFQQLQRCRPCIASESSAALRHVPDIHAERCAAVTRTSHDGIMLLEGILLVLLPSAARLGTLLLLGC